MKRFTLPVLLTLTLILAACAPSQTNSDQLNPPPASVSTEPPQAASTSGNDTSASADLVRIDQQGAITVNVTPLNLANPSDQLQFDVALETHSVDLSMDLATLATLTTDTGITIPATLWDAPRGGHHVAGQLIFPATKDGKSILEGATKLTLTLVNLDAPSRIFEWRLK
ncbi:MAG TPA: hypothetical protein VFR47_08455 [Anaerolineales bacterium]|nr:hypothetical protein [Anaerolineales bacterium]